ncbi:MAG: hypothetical protein JOZ69_24850 [Myxococcales bacterium]|nr:hypothetical protein [Myxococcales bacterium]
MVAYSTAPQALWACLAGQWTAVALPDAGPGPQGPPGPQGDAGLASLIRLTPEPPGANCAAGGQRIDVGLDANGDGTLEPGEVMQTAFVCNGALGSGDAGAGDATSEQTPDATADDGATDAADADADAKVIPPGLLAYGQNYANAICAGFGACCGATFDVTSCESNLSSGGWDNTIPLNRNVYGAGNLTFDATQAGACLTALRNWPCGATLSSAQNQAILSACHHVLGGTIPIGGSGCADAFECVDGAYCDLGTQTCLSLATIGAPCAATAAGQDVQCRNVASGDPAAYCNLFPADGGPSSGAGTCAAAQPDGVGSLCTDQVNFLSDYACQGQVCDIGTASCAPATTNPADPTAGFACASFVVSP